MNKNKNQNMNLNMLAQMNKPEMPLLVNVGDNLSHVQMKQNVGELSHVWQDVIKMMRNIMKN